MLKIGFAIVTALAVATAVAFMWLRLADPIRLLAAIAIWIEIPLVVWLAINTRRAMRRP